MHGLFTCLEAPSIEYPRLICSKRLNEMVAILYSMSNLAQGMLRYCIWGSNGLSLLPLRAANIKENLKEK